MEEDGFFNGFDVKINLSEDFLYPPDPMNQSYIDKIVQLFRTQQQLSFDAVHTILSRSRAQLEKLPNLIEVNVPSSKQVTVVVC
jgi:hypothetical protein